MHLPQLEQRSGYGSRVQLHKRDVVDAATAILDNYGIADLTMRRLGRELNVSPGALYWHFANKQQLLGAIADRILESVGDVSGGWRERIAGVCGQLRDALLSHTDGAELVSASFAADSSLPAYLGLWKEEGLTVEVNTTPGTAAALQLVIGKQADMAVGNAFASMSPRQKGAKVTSYYTSLRGDIYGVALPEGSGLQKLADLKGKVVGVSSFASGGHPYVRALLAAEGLEVGKDVTLAEIGVGGPLHTAKLDDRIDELLDRGFAELRPARMRGTARRTQPHTVHSARGAAEAIVRWLAIDEKS